MREREQAAIEALARHFSAAREMGEAPPDAYLVVSGKRVAVEVTSIPQLRPGVVAKPRLRFDRVALRFVEGLQAALHEAVPDGRTLVVSVTAPIRLPAKTAAALEERIRNGFARRPAQVELSETVHGNQVRARLVKGERRGTSKVIGFVHNPEPEPGALMDMAQSLLECIGAKAGRGVPATVATERWLVIVDEDGLLPAETARHIAQLSVPTDFTKILMVLTDGRVETLAG
jgi:hypothetical protein